MCSSDLILQLNPSLKRSVTARYARARKTWSRWEGLVGTTAAVAPVLAAHRPSARVYSVSALQKYAVCPYQFLLAAVLRLRPAEDLGPLERMDPLTRGSLFHAAQAAFFRQQAAASALPVVAAGRDAALAALDDVVARVAAEHYEALAPAVDRIWHDEIARIRRDLRLWVEAMTETGAEWRPRHFEWAFGLAGSPLSSDRDPDSHPEIGRAHV